VKRNYSGGRKMRGKLIAAVVAASVLWVAGLASAQGGGGATPTTGGTSDGGTAVKPTTRTQEWWVKRHESIVARVKQTNASLVFIGDSITQGWEGAGRETWTKYYSKRNALNLGFSGDETQHVLWRLDNGEFEGISPKLAVVMIGTNNASRSKAEETAAGVKAIIERVRTKSPKTQVLLLAIFPRGKDNTDQRRQVNEKVNQEIVKLGDGKMVFFLSINDKLTEPDGTLSTEVMKDLLHPTAKGYQIWAEAIEPMVAKLMGEK
jgi:lysophospholipase L1-like esterase